MKRAIKFKLKNGKVVTIRRIRGTDYEDIMKFMEKFSKDIGAIQTNQYAGQPKKDKEKSIQMYESNDHLFIGVWDGKNVVGMASVDKDKPNHPYCMGKTAGIGMMMLQKYTHNGIGNKYVQILEKWARENGVYKLWATARHKNTPSIMNLLKNGFIISGIKHNTAYIKGEWHHEYILEKILEK